MDLREHGCTHDACPRSAGVSRPAARFSPHVTAPEGAGATEVWPSQLRQPGGNRSKNVSAAAAVSVSQRCLAPRRDPCQLPMATVSFKATDVYHQYHHHEYTKAVTPRMLSASPPPVVRPLKLSPARCAHVSHRNSLSPP